MMDSYHSTNVRINAATQMSDGVVTVYDDGTVGGHVSIYMDGGHISISSMSATALFDLADKLSQAGAALRDHVIGGVPA